MYSDRITGGWHISHDCEARANISVPISAHKIRRYPKCDLMQICEIRTVYGICDLIWTDIVSNSGVIVHPILRLDKRNRIGLVGCTKSNQPIEIQHKWQAQFGNRQLSVGTHLFFPKVVYLSQYSQLRGLNVTSEPTGTRLWTGCSIWLSGLARFLMMSTFRHISLVV